MVRKTTVALVLAVVLGGVACSEESGSAEELCTAIGDGTGFATTFEGFDPTDHDEALEQLRAARVSLGALHDAAPSEVRQDLSTQIDYVQALIEAVEQTDGTNPADTIRAVQQATDEHEGVQEASDRLAAWAEANCASVTTAVP